MDKADSKVGGNPGAVRDETDSLNSEAENNEERKERGRRTKLRARYLSQKDSDKELDKQPPPPSPTEAPRAGEHLRPASVATVFFDEITRGESREAMLEGEPGQGAQGLMHRCWECKRGKYRHWKTSGKRCRASQDSGVKGALGHTDPNWFDDPREARRSKRTEREEGDSTDAQGTQAEEDKTEGQSERKRLRRSVFVLRGSSAASTAAASGDLAARHKDARGGPQAKGEAQRDAEEDSGGTGVPDTSDDLGEKQVHAPTSKKQEASNPKVPCLSLKPETLQLETRNFESDKCQCLWWERLGHCVSGRTRWGVLRSWV